MYRHLASAVFSIFLLNGCGSSTDSTDELHTNPNATSSPYVQVEAINHVGATAVQKYIKSRLPTIVQEEMDPEDLYIEDPQAYDLFKPMPVNFRMTLYYVGPTKNQLQQKLVTTLDELYAKRHTQWHMGPVTLQHDADFFGSKNELLVIKLSDPTNSLTAWHNEIKQALLAENEAYQKSTGSELFPPECGDRYPFLPHLPIGTVRFGNFIKRSIPRGKREKIRKKLQARIIKEVNEFVQTQSPTERIFEIDNFIILGYQWKVLKKWTL